jgi:hypothetical protein
MQLSLTDYSLWLVSPLLMVGVLIAILIRGLYKEYPYFFIYTILQVLTAPFLLTVRNSPYLYYYSYWAISAISMVISFAVLWEVFREALRAHEALRDFGVILFRWAALVAVLAGGMWAITTIRWDGRQSMPDVILFADRSIRLMQCALVFLILLSSEYVGISRRHVLYGIALGFGVFASANMLVATGLSVPSVLHVSVLRRINLAAQDVAALIWLGYAVLAPSRSAGTVTPLRLRPGRVNQAV